MAKKNQLTTSDYLPYDEYLRLLNCLHKDKEYRWEMYARLSFATACRVSDVLNMKWNDILGKTHIMVVEKKTKKSRMIKFNPSTQQVFRELYELLGNPDRSEYVMRSNSKENKPLTIQLINAKLKIFKYRYGITINHFSTHTFRKTFGRYVYETHNRSSEALVLLNQILKHTSLEVTKRYIGITQDEIDEIYDSICC